MRNTRAGNLLKSTLSNWKSLHSNLLTLFWKQDSGSLCNAKRSSGRTASKTFSASDTFIVPFLRMTKTWARKSSYAFTTQEGQAKEILMFRIMTSDGHTYRSLSMKENMVFMLLTGMIKNFYLHLVTLLSGIGVEWLKQTSRVKRLIFMFIVVPTKWVKTACTWTLYIYTHRTCYAKFGELT